MRKFCRIYWKATPYCSKWTVYFCVHHRPIRHRRYGYDVAVADIVRYINDHEQEDCLLVGFSSQKVNPFREKSSCTVL
ncbi:unnamed protein product [Parnassius apollo]|uniref:(apollo) hypothetical protein n=1 Tax=Parnassius apollo TaxID=110799 RepID=A0A8S3XLZ5_PARAO|nr:unnamed protein product [Parnassius apollo]